jgi:MOSC domain-containing protein YiiM
MGTVAALWTAPEGGAPMERRESVTAVPATGLRGDRYAAGTGHYSGVDGCQVTLVAGEALDAVADAGLAVAAGQHRRNVVTRGVDVRDLLDARVRVGDALLEGTRPRPPCPHLEAVAGAEGLAAALGEHGAGVCADVVEGGEIRPGDEVTVVERLDDPDALAAAIRARHGEGSSG